MHASEFTSDELKMRPTLCVGQCCDLKIESDPFRVWICRVGGGITVETRIGGRWEVTSGDYSSEEG